jgi:hypothetical protein
MESSKIGNSLAGRQVRLKSDFPDVNLIFYHFVSLNKYQIQKVTF